MGRANRNDQSAYGGSGNGNGQRRRGEGFSMDDVRMDRDRQRGGAGRGRRDDRRNEQPRELPLGTYDAWLFDPTHRNSGGQYGAFVRGIPVGEADDGSGDRVLDFTYTIPPEVAGGRQEVVKQGLNVTKWLDKNKRVSHWSGIKLLDIEVPVVNPQVGQPGVLLFAALPGSGGFRAWNEDRGMSASEYRTKICHIELACKDERSRQEAKRSLPRAWHYPGGDGLDLRQRGIQVSWPLFESADERKALKPHEHLLKLEVGAEIECIFEFRHETGSPNWFIIGCRLVTIKDDEGNEVQVPRPYCINVRDPAGEYMLAAQERLAAAAQQERERIAALKSGA